ncbi:hypothetical protein ABZ714_27210 [Streptomyces sp. NPDC006798]|uniref:hypothetical protein n=1 Tax=Streptomyces sp. NPDC006798 TaxID=3155462 RepID=UPI003407CB29
MGSTTGGSGGPLLDSADAPTRTDHRAPDSRHPGRRTGDVTALFLLLVIPVGGGVAVTLTGYGIGTLVDSFRARHRTAARLRALAGLCWGAAAVVYTYGAVLLALSVLSAEDGGTNSSPPPPCWDVPGHREDLERVAGYSLDFLPLRFDCDLTGGGSYDAGAVPGIVNAGAGALTLSGAVVRFAAGRLRPSPDRRTGIASAKDPAEGGGDGCAGRRAGRRHGGEGR